MIITANITVIGKLIRFICSLERLQYTRSLDLLPEHMSARLNASQKIVRAPLAYGPPYFGIDDDAPVE